ncbi:hypothetical protein FYK55_22945 [Roseiconus nitratireducens]|uniref:Uncharacterized protein n=1 Tax=Roseiconus nitratireducens TaxID=2605748 RepID=A0A5M6CXS1_9BACT|nr:hypothetical protein [Roseiconus nitratireducens]KAA5539903.1 hypothetical protein FYK55_22945 [Roseiconus nitratireducens]
MSSEINPYAAPTTTGPAALPQPTPSMPGRLRTSLSFLCASLIVLGCPIAAWFANEDIETIVGSGPALGILSLILLWGSRRADLRGLMPISIAMLLIIFAIFLTIFLLSWRPADAQRPIGTATIFCAGFMQIGILVIAFTAAARKRMAEESDIEIPDSGSEPLREPANA